jgi:hypothetical protein
MTRRRIPLKVAPSPASQRPENKSVEKLVQSSREHQERMRSVAGNHAETKDKPAEPAKTRKQPKRTKPEAKEPKPQPATTTAPKPETNPEKANTASATQPITRKMTLHVPINTLMDSRAGKLAETISKDREYVIAAYLKRSTEALRNRWKAGKLDELLSDAKLLLDQSADSGTRPERKYLALDVTMISDAQSLFDDPLGLLSENKIMSAFLGAEMLAQLTKE